MEEQLHLDLSISKTDVYRLNKKQLIRLLANYGIKAVRGDTCNGTLRPLASILKSLVSIAESNKRHF